MNVLSCYMLLLCLRLYFRDCKGLWHDLALRHMGKRNECPRRLFPRIQLDSCNCAMQLLELLMGNSINCNGANNGNVESVHARSHHSILHLSLFAQQAEPAAMCQPFPLHIFALCISQLAIAHLQFISSFQSNDSLHTGPRHHPSFFFLQHRPH